MKEILIRGKAKLNGHWWEGGIVTMGNGRTFIVPVLSSDLTKDEILHEAGLAFQEVDPDTVGEFTFHIDQHGNKVFDGDICEVTLSNGKTEVMLVFWNERIHRYQLMSNNVCSCSFYRLATFKVIGNIHDDPDLIDDLASAEKKETTDAGSN